MFSLVGGVTEKGEVPKVLDRFGKLVKVGVPFETISVALTVFESL